MYECIFYKFFLFTLKIEETAFSNVHVHSNITAAKLKTTCRHKLDRTEEILQVKQNSTLSFWNIPVILWMSGRTSDPDQSHLRVWKFRGSLHGASFYIKQNTSVVSLAFLLQDNGVLAPLKSQTFETRFQSGIF